MVQLQGVISQRKTPGNADLADPALPVLMTIYPNVETPYDHMAEVIGRIRSSELEEALLVLPLDNVIGLLEVIEQLLARNLKSEVVCRTFFFLVEIHFGSLSGVGSSSKELLRRVRYAQYYFHFLMLVVRAFLDTCWNTLFSLKTLHSAYFPAE